MSKKSISLPENNPAVPVEPVAEPAPIQPGKPAKADLGGVGRNRPDGWVTVNVDTELRAAPDHIADITAEANELAGLFELYSLDAIRCIHVLEHIASNEIKPTLHYWRKFLKPGGELLIVVPDLGKLAIDYADGIIPFDVFCAVAYVPGSRTRDRIEEIHRWGWDSQTLERDLAEIGYKNVRHGGDEHWPATWTFDMTELAYTGKVGAYEVPNLIMVCEA